MPYLLCFMLILSSAFATDQFGQLDAKDQPYYKNQAGDGQNQLERIDSTVREINKMHGEIASMKMEIAQLKKEVEELKKKK